MSNLSNTIHVTCRRSGVLVCTINYLDVNGAAPLAISIPDKSVLHPIYSLPKGQLSHYAGSMWKNFCNCEDAEADGYSLGLRISASAMLHAMADVDQRSVWLPPYEHVFAFWKKLYYLFRWRILLQSPRFKFPGLFINHETHPDLPAYLSACSDAMDSYGKTVRDIEEKARLKAAETALHAIRREQYEQHPKSKKLLWKWLVTSLPARYHRDLAWMQDLWMAETYEELQEYEACDLDLFSEIVLAETPIGTTVVSEVLRRVEIKRKLLTGVKNSFTFTDEFEQRIQQILSIPAPVAQPLIADFPNRVLWMKAHAKWKLSQTDRSAVSAALSESGSTITVPASYMPKFIDYGDEPEPDDNGLDFKNIQGATRLDSASED